ncbi:MAG: DUF6766 family protein [Streptomyces sp.]
MRGAGPSALAVVLLALLGGCGSVQEREDSASAAVVHFQENLRTPDTERGCAALAPGTREELEQNAELPCARALSDAGLPEAGTADEVRVVDMYGRRARVVTGRRDSRRTRTRRWAGTRSPTPRAGQAWYSRSLGTLMCTFFLFSRPAQSVTGVAAYNEEHLRELQAPVSWFQYLGAADFWNRTLRNWQSELLAVGSKAAEAAGSLVDQCRSSTGA